MENYQLYPMQVNPQTGEPFLQLPRPYEHIIITPPRMSDVLPSVSILNDPRVYPGMGMGGPLSPYSPERAESWLKRVKAASDAVLGNLEEANAEGVSQDLKIADGCPVRHIREVKEDGTEVYLGDIGIERSPWSQVVDKQERQRLVDENKAREPGDPHIVWQMGDYLAPSHHGQGIMTAAVATIINQWAIPRMKARKIRATSFKENQASVRVMEKNGFVLLETVEDCVEVQGEKRGLHVLEWDIEKQSLV